MMLACARRSFAGLLCLSLALPACGEGDDSPGNGAIDGGLDGSVGGSLDGALNDARAGDHDGGGSRDGGGGLDHPMSCGASPFEANRVPANVLLVIDKSGSMNKTPAGFSTNKWTALTGALESALTSVQDDLTFGIDLYPVGDACHVPDGSNITVGLAQGSAHVQQIITTLAGTTAAGATPTAAALARALSYYTAGSGSALPGEKFVLLATDGGPNCNDALACTKEECTHNLEGVCFDPTKNCCTEEVGGPGANQYCLDNAETLSSVEALRQAGIPTVVVGIPGSEAFATLLDALAVAGGMPSDGATDYFAVTADGSGAGGLAEVLGRVTRQLIRTCDLQLASVPPDLNELNVEVDGATIPRGSADGWELDTSTNPPTVRLKGATCTAIKSDGAVSVNVTFGCPTVFYL